jgi:hypothetical protein
VIASDDADYGWLAAAVTRLRQIVTTYDLGWETELHPPATWEVIDAAERAIEIPLPPSLHAFYEVHDGADLFGSKLVRESQDYDRRYEVEHDGDAAEEILGSGTLASCKGTCTKTNGGFDEASLDKSSKQIEKGTYRYGRTNSDTAFHKLCVDGGGGFACDHPDTGRRPAPGLGQPLPK